MVEAPPTPNLLVQGTHGPRDGALSSNPYNYFASSDRRHMSVSASPAAARASPSMQHRDSGGKATVPVVAPDWMPTAYAVGTFPVVSMSMASSHRAASSAPASGPPRASGEQGAVRSDDPVGAEGIHPVAPMNPAAPAANLPGGAWVSLSALTAQPRYL